MAAPLDIPMPEGLDLQTGYTLRVTALSPADGSLVAGVVIRDVVVTATPFVTEVGGGTTEPSDWFMVPGPAA